MALPTDSRAHHGDPCRYCGVAFSKVAPGPCTGRKDLDEPFDGDLKLARESYFASGGVESDIGPRPESSWYWRRASLAWRERAESLGRKFNRLGDAWVVYLKYPREEADKHSLVCAARRHPSWNEMGPLAAASACTCGLSALLKELSNGMGLAPEVQELIEHDPPPRGVDLTVVQAGNVLRVLLHQLRGEAMGPGLQLSAGDTARLLETAVRAVMMCCTANGDSDEAARARTTSVARRSFTVGDVCDELGCPNIFNVNDHPLPEGWTRTVVSAPPAPPQVRLRCPEHPLPKGGIVTMGGKQVRPATPPMPNPVCDPSAYESAIREDVSRPAFGDKLLALQRGSTLYVIREHCGFPIARCADETLRRESEFVFDVGLGIATKNRTGMIPTGTKRGPHQAALTDYLSGRFVPGLGPEPIDTVEGLCLGALGALKHADAIAERRDAHGNRPEDYRTPRDEPAAHRQVPSDASPVSLQRVAKLDERIHVLEAEMKKLLAAPNRDPREDEALGFLYGLAVPKCARHPDRLREPPAEGWMVMEKRHYCPECRTAYEAGKLV